VKAVGVFAVWVGSWFAAYSLCVLCTDPPSGRIVGASCGFGCFPRHNRHTEGTVGSGSV